MKKTPKIKLWAAKADGFEARVLLLPFHLPVGKDGWTLKAYSLSQLLKAANLARSTGQVDKLRNYLAVLESAGMLDVRPVDADSSHYRFLWFGNFSPEKSDGGENFPIRARSLDDDDLKESNSSESENLSESSSSDSLKNLPENTREILTSAGVHRGCWGYALGWDAGNLRQLVINAERGKELGRVKSVGAYVAACLEKNPINCPPDNYIALAAQIAAEREAQEAAARREQEEREEQARWQAEWEAEQERLEAVRKAASPQGDFSALVGVEPKHVWAAILGELELQLHPAIYRTWVDGAKLIGFVGQTATVAVENNSIRDWLEERLKPTFERSMTRIARLTGQDGKPLPIEARFVVGAAPMHAGATD